MSHELYVKNQLVFEGNLENWKKMYLMLLNSSWCASLSLSKQPLALSS